MKPQTVVASLALLSAQAAAHTIFQVSLLIRRLNWLCFDFELMRVCIAGTLGQRSFCWTLEGYSLPDV